jgi:hypothetical protein
VTCSFSILQQIFIVIKVYNNNNNNSVLY